MGKLAYSSITIITIALLASIAGMGVAVAAPDSEWSVPMVADAGVEGSNANLEFGIDPGGTDGYDSDIDSLSPPPAPGALFEAYFSIVDPLFPRVNKDLRGEMPNEWTLKMRSTDEDIELSWNTADVPQGVSLTLINTETEIDMKAVNSVILPAGIHTITVLAEQTEIGQYDLTISSTSGGSVTIPGEGTFPYDEGTTVNLIVETEEGYQFVRWTGDVDTIANINAASTTITMQGDYTIAASFAVPPIQYSLTISSTNGGSVTEPGESTFFYNAGTTVNLIVETEEGYQFVRWTGDVDTIANINAASTTIIMQGDYTITADFATPPIQYSLTISSTNGGSVTEPGEGSFAYEEGMAITLVGETQDGYRFISWTGDVDTIGDVETISTTISMERDYNVTANFEEISPSPPLYTVTVNSTDGGSVTTPGEGNFQYNNGTAVNLVAQAEEGYRFVGWTGDVETLADVQAASTTISVESDYAIMANFDEIIPANWALVGGIIAIIVAVGVGIFLFLKRRVT
jgi:hypothetical protein